MDFACKESTKDAVGRLKEAIFLVDSSEFPTHADVSNLFRCADMRTCCERILQNKRGASKFADFKTEDAFRGPNTLLLPILRFPRFRAYDAHAFTQRGARRTRCKESAQDASVSLKTPSFAYFSDSPHASNAMATRAACGLVHTLHTSSHATGC
jgi:hypothetical protein